MKVPVVMTKQDIEALDKKVADAYKELGITVDESRGWKVYYRNNVQIGDSLKDEILQKYFKEKNV